MSGLQVERRLHSRVALPGMTARITGRDGGGRRRVHVVDLSLDGLCWQDSQPADHGTAVTISIRPRWLLGRSIRLEAIVVRHDDTVTAVQFRAVEDRSRLESLLRAKARTLDSSSATVRGAKDVVAPFDAAAAFRLLGVGLDQAESGRVRIIAVTSPRPSDGKSFVTAGLASSLAAMGRGVLVVDADLHAPTQHLQFMVKGSPGLAQVLTDPTSERVRDAIQMTESGAALLPAGAAGIAPSQLMSRDTAAELSCVLRGLGYQVIVIDCPPILTSAETLLFSRLADDTVLTVRSGSTRERDLKQALDVLQRNGTPAAGVILNDYQDAVSALRPARGASAATLKTELPAARDTASFGDAAPLPTGRVPV